MATSYAPSQGQIRVVDHMQSIKKFPLSIYPRAFPSGCPMWLNKVAVHYQAEPCLLTTQQATVDVQATTATADSGYATLALANIPFAPLFLGFAAEARVFQQLLQPQKASVPLPYTMYAQDASRPFISVYDRGIAIAPCVCLTTALEIGDLIQVDGFANDLGVVGFVDPAGRSCTSAGAGYFLYMNRVILSTDPTGSIGWVVERAPIGATEVKFEFTTSLNPTAKTLML